MNTDKATPRLETNGLHVREVGTLGTSFCLANSTEHAALIVKAVNEYDALCAVAEAAQVMLSDGECYCADNVAAKGPCGYCVLKEALAALRKEGQ